MTPAPSLNTAFSIVIQEERHQKVAATIAPRPDAIGFSVQAPSSTIAPSHSRSSIVCDYCGKTRHMKKDCYQLHGYPETRFDGGNQTRGGFGGARGGHGGGRGFANNMLISSSGGSGSNHGITNEDGEGLTLNKDQWNNLVQLLNGPKATAYDRLSRMIIDTGASHHLTGFLELLFDVHDISPCPIGLPNGDVILATRRGKLSLGGSVVLSFVFYVDNLTHTLLYVAKMLKEKSCIAVFTDKFCYVQVRITRTMIRAGDECEGVYYFREVFRGCAMSWVQFVDKSCGISVSVIPLILFFLVYPV